MTEWKPEAGKDAVVRVLGLLTTTDGQYHAQIERSRATIPIAALRPLPTALSAEDAAEDAAILAQADRAEQEISQRGTRWNEERDALLTLVRQRRARRSTPPAAVATFKVGDRVRVVAPTRMKRTGIVVRDIAHEERPFVVDFADNGGGWGRFDASELEPTPDPEPADVQQDSAWVPEVGGRVRTKWVRDISGEPIRGVVTYIGASGDVIYKIDNGGGVGSALPSWLEPDPEPATPRDTTALRDAVVEAARVWRRKGVANNGMGRDLKEYYRLRDATDALLAAEAPPDQTPKESMAETLWPFIKHSMRGCERMEWARVNRGSAAWDMAMHAAEAALSALGDRGRG